MKIGYDAKRFFHNFTGLGNYSRTLIETLTTYFPDNEYHLFTPKGTDNQRVTSVTDHPSVKTHAPNGFWKKAKPIWRSYGIGQDLVKNNVQIFHGLSHELPLSMSPKIRSVVTIHDLIHERYPEFYPFIDRKIYSLKFKQACHDADIVVAISEQTKRDIVDFYNIAPAKIQVIYQSCHRQFYQNNFGKNTPTDLKTKYKLPPQYLLYVGTVNERKNLLGLLKALQSIDNQQDIHLVVIGDGGDYFQKTKKYAAENGLNNRVHWLPKMDFADLPQIYKSAKALVLPSFFEGFGIPIIEALWSGTPVITSEGSCFPEAGGAGAIYVNPNETDAIADVIQQIWQNESLRNDLILRGGKYVQKFHEKEIGAQWQQLYASLL